MWRCEDVDQQMWRCEDVDLQMWGCEEVDLQMWGCEDVDLQRVKVWRCRSADVRVWRCRSADVRVWRCRSAEISRSEGVKRRCRSADVKVWRGRSADVRVWRCRSADVKVWRCRSADVKVWRCRSADVKVWRCRWADVRVWRCRSAGVKVWRCSIAAAFLRRTLRRRCQEKCWAISCISYPYFWRIEVKSEVGLECCPTHDTGSKMGKKPAQCIPKTALKTNNWPPSPTKTWLIKTLRHEGGIRYLYGRTGAHIVHIHVARTWRERPPPSGMLVWSQASWKAAAWLHNKLKNHLSSKGCKLQVPNVAWSKFAFWTSHTHTHGMKTKPHGHKYVPSVHWCF